MAAFRFTLLAACLAVPTLANAHGGGLDAHGCHHNRKAGGYHCHQGPFAKQSFASKAEMLRSAAAKVNASMTAAAGELIGNVVSIHDGDTLTVLVAKRQIRIRLDGIDAPERGQPFGKRSQQSLAEMFPSEQKSRTADRIATGARSAALAALAWTRMPSR